MENEPIQHIGRQARSIKEAFDALTAPAKNEESGEEPAGAQEEDKVLANAKEQFNALWDEFRKKREKFAAQMAVEQKANLEERLALIEELKQLIEKEENASIRDFTAYKYAGVNAVWCPGTISAVCKPTSTR